MSTVADAMITRVKLSPPDVTVGSLVAFFADEHVHVAVIVDSARLVLAVVDRDDLRGHPPDTPALDVAPSEPRTVDPTVPAEQARQTLLASGRRRLAVVDGDGRLLGLLCLKRTRRGFCSNRDVAARSAERARAA